MSKTETYSVRLDPELKEKFQEIARESDFADNREFFRYLKELYNMDQISEDIPDIKSDFQTLQKLTNQINSIFTNIADKMKVSLQESEEDYQKKLVELYELLDQREDELEKIKGNYREEKEQLEESIEKKETIIDNLENKVNKLNNEVDSVNDTLFSKTELIDRIKKENKNLQEELTKAEEKLEEYNKIKNKLDEVEKENNQLSENNERLKDEIKNLKATHQEELENIKNKLKNEKEAVILEVKNKYQDKIEKIRMEKNDKIESLMGKLEESN